ncbi:MAG: hypothetical protein AABX66_02070 [Nanoarchaeota archaeon]
MVDNNNSRAYQGICDPDDAVHDFERKAPLGDWDVIRMLRVQPSEPKNSRGDYRPEDPLDLIRALNQNKSSIIPTTDLAETYYHMSHRTDGENLKIKVSSSEDEGWSRIEVDVREGRLAREIFKEDFPDLYR